MIYHVTCDHDTGQPMVEAQSCQNDSTAGFAENAIYERSTLHGAAEPDGASEYVVPGGLVVRLLAESFSPYRATVRIERCQEG